MRCFRHPKSRCCLLCHHHHQEIGVPNPRDSEREENSPGCCGRNSNSGGNEPDESIASGRQRSAVAREERMREYCRCSRESHFANELTARTRSRAAGETCCPIMHPPILLPLSLHLEKTSCLNSPPAQWERLRKKQEGTRTSVSSLSRVSWTSLKSARTSTHNYLSGYRRVRDARPESRYCTGCCESRWGCNLSDFSGRAGDRQPGEVVDEQKAAQGNEPASATSQRASGTGTFLEGRYSGKTSLLTAVTFC